MSHIKLFLGSNQLLNFLKTIYLSLKQLVTCNVTGYTCDVIVSFKHKGLEKFFLKGDGSKLNPQHLDKIGEILTVLHAAISIQDLNVPGYGLHQLKGNLKGHWAVKISGNWRITFKFVGENIEVLDVNYVDYH